MPHTIKHLKPIAPPPEAIPSTFAAMATDAEPPNAVMEHIYRGLAAGVLEQARSEFTLRAAHVQPDPSAHRPLARHPHLPSDEGISSQKWS